MSRFVWVFPAVFVITVAVALSVSAQGEIDGAVIYQERCAFCHGDQGDGNGPVAQYLDPRPRDFTAGQFKFRTTASGELPLRQDVIDIVKAGVRGTAMPRWKACSPKPRSRPWWITLRKSLFRSGAPMTRR